MGYTFNAFFVFKLYLVPGILNEATPVEVVELNESFPFPWNMDRLTPVYQFEFKNKIAYDNHKPFYIQFHYEDISVNTSDYKQVFFYDKNHESWRPLPTKDFFKEGFVRSLIHLPYARIAVFSYPGVMNYGKASWYKYRGGNFAASPDFSKGSKIRVTNLENDKYVDVEINDWGPERDKFPDRVIDLDKVAFSRIASVGAGIIEVGIEPLFVEPGIYGEVIGDLSAKALHRPGLSSKSAIIIDEETGEVIFEKNGDAILPMASLAKLVSVYTYLEMIPDLDRKSE